MNEKVASLVEALRREVIVSTQLAEQARARYDETTDPWENGYSLGRAIALEIVAESLTQALDRYTETTLDSELV